MSGIYVYQGPPGEDVRALAQPLAAQIASGNERVNHFAVDGATLLGLVTQDKFGQGIMPRYLEAHGLWGILHGELHESDTLAAFRAKHPGVETDLEVFTTLWRGGGLEAALPTLNGAFFVVLWDPAAGELVAVNDRYGLYPMYWAHQNGRFCLAARTLCSVLSGAADGSWDPAGIAQLMVIDDLLGETTMLKGVSAYPQATLMVKRGDMITWRKYWQYDYTPLEHFDLMEAGEELGRRMIEAVRRQSRRAKRIGVTLSGGLDSRCLTASAAKLGIPVNTFTWGKPNAYDRRFAKQVAAAHGFPHHDYLYRYKRLPEIFGAGARIVEGLMNLCDWHMLFHLDILEANADLILNGYAGGLILGGSFLRSAWMRPLSPDALAEKLFTWRNTLAPESQIEDIIPGADTVRDRLPSALFKRIIDSYNGMAAPDMSDRFFLEGRERRLTAIGTVILRTAVESAACFFDYDLIDLTTRVPAQYRFEHQVYLAMMHTTFPEAMHARWQRTLLRPSAPIWQAKGAKAALKAVRILESKLGWPQVASQQSPVDFERWMRGDLRPVMRTILFESDPLADEAIRPTFCRRVWQEHLAGARQARMLGAIASIKGFAGALSRARAKVPASACVPTEVTRG